MPDDMVVVQRGDVARAKPEPDLFVECAPRLGVEAEDCYVVGDAVWDLLAARRARMLSIGLLSGGYGADELRARRLPRLPRRGRATRLAGRARRERAGVSEQRRAQGLVVHRRRRVIEREQARPLDQTRRAPRRSSPPARSA